MKNVGSIDRVLRVALGLVILGAGWHFGSWLGLIGIVPILTAVFGFCPLYCSLKLSTCGKPAAAKPGPTDQPAK